MDKAKIYSKTGKGVLEVKNKTGKLPKDLARTLALIDGKSPMSDLLDRTRLNEAEIGKVIAQLIDGGYIKEFANSSRASGASPAGSAYVDDLDFTSSLTSGKSVYQSAQSEWRQRETADRTKAEEDEKRKREEAERLKKEQAQRQLRADSQRLAAVEAERKAKEAAALRLREETERNAKQQEEMMARTQRDMQKVLEAERKAFEQAELKRQQEEQEKGRIEGNILAREDEARRIREEEDRRRIEEEARRKKEEDERRSREAEDRRRKEEEERRRKDEEERRKREDEERRRKEEEDRRRKEEEDRRRKEEEERRKQEEEERRRREAELLKLREEEERKRREAEELSRKRKEEEERLRREEEERRLRREEEARRQRDEEERRRQEEARVEPREEVKFDLGQIDLSGLEGLQAPAARTELPALDMAGLQAMDTQVVSEFDKQQELLRRRDEEEDRQREAAERARMEEERAQREEYAREEAVRRQAEEQERRERMEGERADREERERKREEEKEQRNREQEEARKQAALERERQEAGRLDSERRSREEALKNRRKEQEQRDRKRSTVETLKKTRSVKTPLDRLKSLIIGMVVLAAVVVGGIQLVPLNIYVPNIEKLASEHIKEPVSIGSVKLSVLNGLALVLEDVKLGATQDLKIGKVSLSTNLGSLFGEIKVVDVLTAESVTIAEEALQRLPKWAEAAVSDKSVQIGRVAVKSAKLESQSLQMPGFDATIQFLPDGTIRSGNVSTTDGKFQADFSPNGTEVAISVKASKGWIPPLGAPVEFTELTARVLASPRRIKIESFEAFLYGGVAKGSASIQWGGSWSLEGNLATERVGMQELIAAFSREAKITGQLESAVRYSMTGPNLATLFDAPRLDGTFTLRKGDLDGIDLVRALQSGARGAVQGGATRFEELSGTISLANGHYAYRGLKLSSGLLSASGGFEISPAKDVSGKVFVELRSQAAHIRGNFNVDGNLKAVILFPN